MIEFSLWDKIVNLMNLIFSSPLFLILLFGILVMIVDIKLISKRSKSTKIIYTIVAIILIILLLYSYFNSLLNVLDVVFENFVNFIYFPTILEYVLTILISIIIVIVTIFNKKTNSKIKTVNYIVAIINTFIFFLILDQINKNKIDLTSKISIYSNDNLMMLFELAIIIFVLWMIGLILYEICYKLTHKEIENNFYDIPELPKTIEELRKEELKIAPQIEYVVVEKKNENDMFTLEEYRQMKKLLEKIKENNKES